MPAITTSVQHCSIDSSHAIKGEKRNEGHKDRKGRNKIAICLQMISNYVHRKSK